MVVYIDIYPSNTESSPTRLIWWLRASSVGVFKNNNEYLFTPKYLAWAK